MRRTVLSLYTKGVHASCALATRLTAICACVAISACGASADADPSPLATDDQSVGVGFLAEADLRSVVPPHFTSPPAPVEAELVLLDKGCVAVDVGGTQRMPIWP